MLHGVHALAPGNSEYVLTGHSWHSFDFDELEKRPAGHWMHAVDVFSF
jgi:hypothetical protein